LNSYLNFIKKHNYSLDPTADTLSLFTVYMCHHIKPGSVGTYLSGICHQLEPYFPDVRISRNSALVHCTLQGCKRIHAVPTSRKRALTITDLETVVNTLSSSTNFDNHLFLVQLLTRFFALFHLGEMTYPDDPSLWDPRKVTKQNSVHVDDSSYRFFLPSHKADRFFEGNTVIICKTHTNLTLTCIFWHTCVPKTMSFHSALPYGSPAREPFQPGLSSSRDYANSLTLTQLDNHSEPEVQRPSLKMEYLHL